MLSLKSKKEEVSFAVRVKDRLIGELVVYNFDFIETTLDDVKEQNRQSVISYATLAGFEKDRNTQFIFNKKHAKSARYKRNKIKNAGKVTKTSKREIKKLTQTKQAKPKKEKKSKKQNKATPKED